MYHISSNVDIYECHRLMAQTVEAQSFLLYRLVFLIKGRQTLFARGETPSKYPLTILMFLRTLSSAHFKGTKTSYYSTVKGK